EVNNLVNMKKNAISRIMIIQSQPFEITKIICQQKYAEKAWPPNIPVHAAPPHCCPSGQERGRKCRSPFCLRPPPECRRPRRFWRGSPPARRTRRRRHTCRR